MSSLYRDAKDWELTWIIIEITQMNWIEIHLKGVIITFNHGISEILSLARTSKYVDNTSVLCINKTEKDN